MTLDDAGDKSPGQKSLRRESRPPPPQGFSDQERKVGRRELPGSPTVLKVSSGHSHVGKAQSAFQEQGLARVFYPEWSSQRNHRLNCLGRNRPVCEKDLDYKMDHA